MKDIICILANDYYNFEQMCKNFPQEVVDDKLIIVIEDRIGTDEKRIKDILSLSGLDLDYKILKASKISQKFKEDVTDTKFVDEYTMSMNILGLWYIFKYYKKANSILAIDEDEIMFDGINSIFDGEDKHLVDTLRRAQGNVKESKKHFEMNKEIASYFNLEYTQEIRDKYFRWYGNGGCNLWYKNNFDLKLYEEALKLFFESKLMREIWLKSRRQNRRYTAYQYDERFLTLYTIKLNQQNDYMKPFARLILSKKCTEKELIGYCKKVLVHNCCGVGKKETYEKLRKAGCIK